MQQAAGSVVPSQEGAVLPRSEGALAVVEGLRNLGPGRILALGVVGLSTLAFLAYLVLRASEGSYTLLYGDLELEDGREIVERLETMGVPFRLTGDGRAVMVPRDQALRLRMSLAEDGIPAGGSVGYEVFDDSSALGTRNFLSNVNLRRALEGELARTIAAIGPVRTARVHIVQPKRDLFRRDRVEPSASIVVTMRGGNRLDPRQVQAIAHLAAAAVPGLEPGRVTIVDQRGTLLARDGEGDAVAATDADAYRSAFEHRLKHTVEDLLQRSLGPGTVEAQVSADITFDQITTTEESFDPESQVARSTQTVEEETELSETDPEDTVSVANNLPTAPAPTGNAATSNERMLRSEETVNYEISRTVRNHTRRGGQIRRLSIAVLVDGVRETGPAGQPQYAARSDEELEQLAALVRTAVGFDAERGDVVEVVNRPFALMAPDAESEDTALDLGAIDVDRLIELAVLGLVGLALVFFVLRPALKRLLPASGGPEAQAGHGRAALPAPAGSSLATAALPAAGPRDAARPDGAMEADDVSGEERVEVRQIEGPVRASLLDRAASITESSPDEAVRVVRHWLNEG